MKRTKTFGLIKRDGLVMWGSCALPFVGRNVPCPALVIGSLVSGVVWSLTVQRVFIRVLQAVLGAASDPEHTKAVHQLSELATYLGLVSFGLGCLRASPCYTEPDGKECWAGSTIPVLDTFLALQLGSYIQMVVTERLLKQMPTPETVIHHVITVIMLSGCAIGRYAPMGLIISLAHDMSTPPVKLSRALHILGYDRAKGPTFVVFALIFFTSRLVVYPYAAVLPSYRYLVMVSWDDKLGTMIFVLCCVLYALDLFFFHEVVGVLVRRGADQAVPKSKGRKS